jgi:predicted nucleotidyltransferase
MKREKLIHIFKKRGVRIAYLFGSQKEAGIAFLEGGATKIDGEVDLDIGVVFKIFPEDAFEAYGELYADISLFFEPFTVDLVFLQETDALFQYEAITGELVFSDDELYLEEYEEQVMKRASDLSFKRNEFEKDFLEAVKDGYFEIEHR